MAADAVLVDVREPHELQETGWLAGAVNMPMSSFAERAKSLPKGRPVVLYCRSGRRAEIAGRMLRELGFEAVYNLGRFAAAVESGWASRRG